jgi:adenylosuccinate synthase
MKKKIHICIGANYGDEGKGRTTDYFAMQSNKPIIVRFNGGAQAGHSVNFGEHRHVFSHFGAATLRNIPSYFTKDFVCCPDMFVMEYVELREKMGYKFVEENNSFPKQYYNEKCLITSPWDVIVNRVKEFARGTSKHGSVGLGFGETIERQEKFSDITLNVRHLHYCFNSLDKEKGKQYFIEMCRIYVNEYFTPIFDQYKDVIKSCPDIRDIVDNFESVAYTFYKLCRMFIEKIEIVNNEVEFLKKFDDIIFEGAQGLALDQNSKDFPHVTRSNTGVKNVLNAVNALKNDFAIEVSYVSRPYFTRHGAGPLRNEVRMPSEIGFHVVDKTNVLNDFQDHLRFASFNLGDFSYRIVKDFSELFSNGLDVDVSVNLVFSCMDQISDKQEGKFVVFDKNQQKANVDKSEFFEMIKKHFTFLPNLNIISFQKEEN